MIEEVKKRFHTREKDCRAKKDPVDFYRAQGEANALEWVLNLPLRVLEGKIN